MLNRKFIKTSPFFLQHHTLPQLLRASTLIEEDDGFSSLEVSALGPICPISPRAATPPPTRSAPKVRTKVAKSASMKLKWFPAFRLGGSNHSTNNNSNNGGSSNGNGNSSSNSKQTQPSSSQQNNQPIKNSLKTASTASLVRRSSSRLNISSDVALNPTADDYGSTATPILLSVRKRSTSDSGYSGNSGEDYTSSSHCGDDSPVVPSAKPHRGPKNIHGLSFLRLFHKSSATLQLQHPKTELNPEKPYKTGTGITTAADHHMKKKTKDYLRGHHHKRKLIPMASSSLSSLNTINSQPLAISGHHHQASGSGHHGGISGAASNTNKNGGHPQHQAFSSSNSVASDESSANGSSSTYDSGAFSRTSSPDPDVLVHPPLNLSSLSMSRLALTEPLVAPRLVLAATRGEWGPNNQAPGILLNGDGEQILGPRPVSHMKKKPLNLAERNRQIHRRQMRARSMSSAAKPSGNNNNNNSGSSPGSENVTVTVGSSTLLTIGLNGAMATKTINNNSNATTKVLSAGNTTTTSSSTSVTDSGIMLKKNSGSSINPGIAGKIQNNQQNAKSSNLRRSRSGLPVLGTTALNNSPVKPLRTSAVTSSTSLQRSKISTVYLEDSAAAAGVSAGTSSVGTTITERSGTSTGTKTRSSPTKRFLERSGSVVTVMGSQPSGVKCDCTERVTVNGQHHCANPIRSDLSKVDRSTNTTPNPPGMKSTLIHL